MDELYYSHNGKGPQIARIIKITDQYVEFEIKSGVYGKRWLPARLSRMAWDRSGWKLRQEVKNEMSTMR